MSWGTGQYAEGAEGMGTPPRPGDRKKVHLAVRERWTGDVDPIEHPRGYVSHPSGIEPIQITAHETFLRGNIIKYVMRAPYKENELQDLKKAAQYLQWEIERVERSMETTEYVQTEQVTEDSSATDRLEEYLAGSQIHQTQ